MSEGQDRRAGAKPRSKGSQAEPRVSEKSREVELELHGGICHRTAKVSVGSVKLIRSTIELPVR